MVARRGGQIPDRAPDRPSKLIGLAFHATLGAQTATTKV